MTIHLGLCSVALRHRDLAEAVACAVAGGAVGIEWEARVHVPPGDRERARRAADLSRQAGLQLPSYGSYVRAGTDSARADFAESLISAVELGVQQVRVWAGDTKDLPDEQRSAVLAKVAADLAAMCDMAADANISVGLEFHPGTFTETAGSTLDLMDRVGRANLCSYWQPDYGQPLDAALASLETMLPLLGHLHVFHWLADHTRLPLSTGTQYWHDLLKLAGLAPPAPTERFAFVEFSRGDDPAQVTADLQVLGDLLRATDSPAKA